MPEPGMPAVIKNTTLGQVWKVVNKDIARAAWFVDSQARGKKVETYRNYVDGDHDARLTKERVKALNLPLGTKSAFTTNYCDTVVTTFADRLILDKILADSDEGTQWVERLLDANDFDELHMDLHEAAIRDADSYLLASFPPGAEMAHLTLEPAWDGSEGMLVVYTRQGGRRKLDHAIKVWSEEEVLRVNVYYADRIEKYSNEAKKGLVLLDEGGFVPWLDRNGQPLGVPVIHFANRRRRDTDFGISELENIVPLQDGLNRAVHGGVMTSEYQAFLLRYSVGLAAPDEIGPGSWVEWAEKTNVNGVEKAVLGIPKEAGFEVGSFEQGDLTPFIDLCNWFINQIGFISRTPSPEMMGGSNESGEALKQREVGLVGKSRRFSVKADTSWRQAMRMAHKVQTTFGDVPVPIERFTPKWKEFEVRNDSQVVDNALKIKDEISRAELLRQVAEIFDWDDTKIQTILDEKAEEDRAALAAAAASTPNFANADFEF